MRPRRFLVTSAILSLFYAGALPGLVHAGLAHAEASEETAKVNGEESTKNKPDDNITYLMVSAELAAVAREMKDPILMLAAAHLEALTAARAEPKEKTSEGEAKTEDSERAENKALYALAEEYAGSNETLLAAIKETKGPAGTQSRGCCGTGSSKASMGVRGYADDTAGPSDSVSRRAEYPPDDTRMRRRTSGRPASHIDTVLAGRTDVYRQSFEGGKFAEVAVSGDGDTDLDLYVYDENGNHICSDTDWSDQAYCSWHPQWTGSFRIEVRNLGGVYNEYMLLTN